MSDVPGAIGEAAQHDLPCELVHDLRSPLGVIMGYSELLIEQLHEAGHDEFVPGLERIRAAGYQLLALIEENFQSR
jgi:signal transduction histidine kinase